MTACVLIPFRDPTPVLEQSLQILCAGLDGEVEILCVDDGSTRPLPGLERFRAEPRCHFLRHETARGPAAARNAGIEWCRARGVAVVILLDSDCLPGEDFVAKHVRWHREDPEAVCIGAGIEGVGRGFWARLDGILSWFTSVPGSPPRTVRGVYHIPTTNMSLKLPRLPISGALFEESLRTGEDVHFMATLQRAGLPIRFYPEPVVRHFDRETAGAVIRHQYRWAVHTYSVRYGGRGPIWVRAGLAAAFTALVPVYALASSYLTLRCWHRGWRWHALYALPVFGLYLLKGIGVAEGILLPGRARLTRAVAKAE